MMLIAKSNIGKNRNAKSIESGIAASVMSAVRTFSNVRKMTSMTTIPAVSSVSAPLASESSMKSDWR